jgi:hypothetical protein
MKHKDILPGDRVTYLDIIHATVMHSSANGVVITYWGRGKRMGEQIQERVSARWLEKGWKAIDEFEKGVAK